MLDFLRSGFSKALAKTALNSGIDAMRVQISVVNQLATYIFQLETMKKIKQNDSNLQEAVKILTECQLKIMELVTKKPSIEPTEDTTPNVSLRNSM